MWVKYSVKQALLWGLYYLSALNTQTHTNTPVCNKRINLTWMTLCPSSTQEIKATVVQNDTGDSIMLKKKLKMKKKRLKEEVRQWEESRRCSDGPSDEPEASEPTAKKNTTEDNRKGKQSAGMCIWTCIHMNAKQSMFGHSMQNIVRNVRSCCYANGEHTVPFCIDWSRLRKFTQHHHSFSAFCWSERLFHDYKARMWLTALSKCE